MIPHTDLQPYTSRWASISVDARFVLYKLQFPGSNFGNVVLYDRQTDSSTLISSNSRPVRAIDMSSDGRFVAYDDADQVYLWDRCSNAAPSPTVFSVWKARVFCV